MREGKKWMESLFFDYQDILAASTSTHRFVYIKKNSYTYIHTQLTN